MLLEVIRFNKIRNGFNLDEQLEIDMLQEEIQEFFDAETTAERLDAYVDTLYVWEGTKMKYLYNAIPIPESAKQFIYDFLIIASDTLKKETASDFTYVVQEAKQIVTEVNAMKISKLDENGKVMKQDDLPNATELIAEMLEKVLPND